MRYLDAPLAVAPAQRRPRIAPEGQDRERAPIRKRFA